MYSIYRIKKKITTMLFDGLPVFLIVLQFGCVQGCYRTRNKEGVPFHTIVADLDELDSSCDENKQLVEEIQEGKYSEVEEVHWESF